MSSVNRSITNHHRTVTNRTTAALLSDQNSNLTPLHLQLLQWVEGRRADDTRPRLPDISPFIVDSAVAELVLRGLVKAVAIPRSRYDTAHWEPTGLTPSGRKMLARHRRSQPEPSVPQPWWHFWRSHAKA
jgi:hypothetical protein